MELRQQGLSLAQIAERQKVDPQRLVDALVAQWTERIDARLANGGITADQATTLRANVAVRAKAMVQQTTHGRHAGRGCRRRPERRDTWRGCWRRHGRRCRRRAERGGTRYAAPASAQAPRDAAERCAVRARERHVPIDQHGSVELITSA